MLNIQELANFITEKLNIISADNGASYVFDIYAEIGHNENDGHIKGTIISKSNNPLVVKSLASAKIIYVVELAIPNGMANKKLIEIQNIIGEFVRTYEGTEQDFETGKASFELTYAHLPENYSVKNETGGIVPLQFEITLNYTDNGLLGSSKVWLLNGAEIPYMNEVILLNKEGQTNRISREKYNKTIVLAQTKFYKFTIPFDTTNTVCTTLQADMLNGDFDKTYTLSYYDGTTYTSQNPFTTTVSIYQSGDSKSDGGSISMFDITFADVSAVEVAPTYTLELFSTPFDEQNERWFDSVDEQTEWYDDLDVKTPAVQIKAPNLNTISNTTQVYDFNGIANFPYTETEVANMNVARITEQTTKPNVLTYTIEEHSSWNYSGEITNSTYDTSTYVTYTNLAGGVQKTIVLGGETYLLSYPIINGGYTRSNPVLYDLFGNEIIYDEYYEFTINGITYAFENMTQSQNLNGRIRQNGITVTSMQSDSYWDWKFQLNGVEYYVNVIRLISEAPTIIFNIYDEDGQIAQDVSNGGEFTIVDGNIVNRYYYTIQSAEIGANKQVILTLRLNTFQTYVINPQLQFSECFINKAHLNRFVDNGDNTVSFNGGLESPLFEREDIKNVAKRMVARQVLKYDFGDYSNVTDPTILARYKRVEEWWQSNVKGWLYAYLPKNKVSVASMDVIIGETHQWKNIDFDTTRYRTFEGGSTIDSNFVVFACPLYKTSKHIIFNKQFTVNNNSVIEKLSLDQWTFMSYLQTREDSSTQSVPYSVKFSTKPPIVDFATFLSGFDVVNGNLESIESSTVFDSSKETFSVGVNFKAVRLEFDTENPGDINFDGALVVTSSLLPTLDMEDYIIVNPMTFPKSNSSYINKTFYKINRPYIKTTVPQSFTLVRPMNVQRIDITISYVDTNNDIKNDGLWVENVIGSYLSTKYRVVIKDATITLEINQLPTNFSYFTSIEFKQRVYGIMGADKNPMYNPKLLSSDYRALKLTNERGAEFDYDIQKLNQETIKTAVTEQITADLQKSYFRIMDTDGVYQEKCEENLTGLVDSAETSIPLATDPWKKTLAEQPNFFKQRDLNNMTNMFSSVVGGGAAGALGGVAAGALGGLTVGGPVGAAIGGAIGIASGLTKTMLRGINEDLTLGNMDKQPYSIQNAGGNVVFNLSYTEVGMTIEQHALLPQEERIINDQMFANGYTYNRIDQLRNFTHTRKYFNTLVANIETMSGLPLSNEVRDDIRQRFANGVRLWHTDEIQYEKENYELWLEEE